MLSISTGTKFCGLVKSKAPFSQSMAQILSELGNVFIHFTAKELIQCTARYTTKLSECFFLHAKH